MAAILLTGDVMLGRGIDQILQQPSEPELFEPFVRSALDYVGLAEARNGPIPRGVDPAYVWGDALEAFRTADARIVNLETAVTCHPLPAPKGINYRCHPANLCTLEAASIDCCVLANNHVLDWGEEGLIETLSALEAAGVPYAGAGRDSAEAQTPAIVPSADGGRILVYALASPSSGVPPSWEAAPGQPGVHLLTSYSREFVASLAARIRSERAAGDIVIVSIHWGSNWGYDVPQAHRTFAHLLIDEAGVDIVHGHSSHHPMAIELHRNRPIFYGCGDFLNDYEGISGHEEYRPDLVLAYRVSFDAGGGCSGVELLPYRIARFRLNNATSEEADWLARRLDLECGRFGGRVELQDRILRPAQQAEVE